MSKSTVFWFRRDLRLHDNHGFFQALTNSDNVIPLFIFDRNILDDLEDKDDPRVTFIHDVLSDLRSKLKQHGSDLLIRYGYPFEIWKELVNSREIGSVFYNHDYEPYAKDRDLEISKFLEEEGIEVHTYKDQVIFEKEEVVKQDRDPYSVFTPYKRQWFDILSKNEDAFKHYPSELHLDNLHRFADNGFPSLSDMGFERSEISIPDKQVSQGLIKAYGNNRDYPAREGTTRLGIHFRFGTISIREKARKAKDLSNTFLNELIWRDFYQMILFHHPRVVEESFRPKYDRIPWRNNEEEFEAWKAGKTGYPLVDAGMRQLAGSGYMHNRIRMLTASFLTKHLLIDWRWGEAWFARKLLDYELASNNGGWQWAAGSGCDAAPYFRIFNPMTQQKKFDPQHEYIREWVPEYGTDEYPEPIVEHKFGRERALETYKKALDDN